jgi:hypothetical protein
MENWQTRIETKLDKLTEVVEQLARVEERQLADRKQLMELQKKQNQFESQTMAKMDKLAESVNEIARTVNDNARTSHAVNKVFWLVLGSAVAVVVSAIVGGNL